MIARPAQAVVAVQCTVLNSRALDGRLAQNRLVVLKRSELS